MILRFSLVSISLLLFFQMSVAQEVPTRRSEKTIDTSSTYKWLKNEVKNLDLNDLTKTKEKFYFRFWSNDQLVEIWTDDMEQFEGRLISYTRRYNPDPQTVQKRFDKIYSKYITLDNVTSKLIYERVDGLSLFDIPDQTRIKKWKQGVDGNSVFIEFASPHSYSMKYYWSPDFQVEIPEATAINNFDKFLKVTLALRDKYNSFFQSLPRGCYNNGGIVVICNHRKKSKRKS